MSGFTELVGLLNGLADGQPAQDVLTVPIAIGTDKNLLVVALQAAGKRYHDITISNSGVWRILKRLDLNRLPASQRYQRRDRRWKRYEKPLPGHQVQIDVKFIQPLPAAEVPRRPGSVRRRNKPRTAPTCVAGSGPAAYVRSGRAVVRPQRNAGGRGGHSGALTSAAHGPLLGAGKGGRYRHLCAKQTPGAVDSRG